MSPTAQKLIEDLKGLGFQASLEGSGDYQGVRVSHPKSYNSTTLYTVVAGEPQELPDVNGAISKLIEDIEEGHSMELAGEEI